MNKIEHIGIAVKNMETSNKLFTSLFGQEPYKKEVVESEGVTTSFFQIGPNKIELLEGMSQDKVKAYIISLLKWKIFIQKLKD